MNALRALAWLLMLLVFVPLVVVSAVTLAVIAIQLALVPGLNRIADDWLDKGLS